MNPVFKSLQPEKLWYYFGEICKIPRPSKNESRISKFVLDVAHQGGFETSVDDAGNILIKKPASKGFDHLPVVVLQSHLDMVCEKNNDTFHDFNSDPILPRIEGEWVKATGTTLGADDGIGIAAQLAILVDKDIVHGPLEMLFTVDEETGLTGAKNLQPGFVSGRILLNLDSEDEGELFIGCAGGKDTRALMHFSKMALSYEYSGFKINVGGLTGGHSGDDINKGRGNAIKIITRILWQAANHYELRISSLQGGNLRNAIPREAEAMVVVPRNFNDELRKFVLAMESTIKAEMAITEPGLRITCQVADLPSFIIDHSTQDRLLNALYACPHGVIAMSQSISNFVETSTNLASVKMGDKSIEIGTSQRSSAESTKEDIVNMVDTVFRLAGCKTSHDDGYPGWAPNPNSPILEITRSSYLRLFGSEPKVLAIHAGLECGLIGEQYPGMDMISFGPTIKGAHSPDERLEIASVQKFWDLTLDVLRSVGSLA